MYQGALPWVVQYGRYPNGCLYSLDSFSVGAPANRCCSAVTCRSRKAALGQRKSLAGINSRSMSSGVLRFRFEYFCDAEH